MIRRCFDRPARVAALLLLVLFRSVQAQSADDVWTGIDRVVAVGDVHGDDEQFAAVLRSAGLIDSDGHWIGGTTHLVQTGDILDRGPDSRKAMDFLMRLEEEAAKAGGAVHALIGNHEAMNLYGDLRYVSAGEFAAFRDAGSEQARDELYKAEQKKYPDRKRWDAEHPLGFAEHRRAFGPDGKYGKWIRAHNAVIRIDGTLFLHGGISPKYVGWSVRKINEQVRAELEDFTKLEGGIVQDEKGPLWYRGLAQSNEKVLEDHVRKVLSGFQVERVAIGHTFTKGAVMPRFDGKVLMIDIGLSRVYDEQGRMACLVIEKGKPYVLHRGTRVDLPSDSEGDLARYVKRTNQLDRDAHSKEN